MIIWGHFLSTYLWEIDYTCRVSNSTVAKMSSGSHKGSHPFKDQHSFSMQIQKGHTCVQYFVMLYYIVPTSITESKV